MSTRLRIGAALAAAVLLASVGLLAQRALLVEADQGPFRHVVLDDQGPRDPWGKGIGDIDGDGLPDLVAGGTAAGWPGTAAASARAA